MTGASTADARPPPARPQVSTITCAAAEVTVREAFALFSREIKAGLYDESIEYITDPALATKPEQQREYFLSLVGLFVEDLADVLAGGTRADERAAFRAVRAKRETARGKRKAAGR